MLFQYSILCIGAIIFAITGDSKITLYAVMALLGLSEVLGLMTGTYRMFTDRIGMGVFVLMASLFNLTCVISITALIWSNHSRWMAIPIILIVGTTFLTEGVIGNIHINDKIKKARQQGVRNVEGNPVEVLVISMIFRYDGPDHPYVIEHQAS